MSSKVVASALFNHVVQPYVGTGLLYDNNVLRLPDDSAPDASGNKITKDSFIKQIKAGLSATWQISQQQLIVDASINQNWFSTFNELNYTGHNVLGQWNWRLGKRLKGGITYNHRLLLGDFRQINRLTNNLENRESYIANGAYEIFPDWYLRAGFTRASTRYPSEARQQSNLLENSQEFGLRYINTIDNMLGFSVTIADGKYTSRPDSSILDNAYTRVSYNIDGRWNYSVKTRIRGQIGYTSQDFAHIKSRNFSDITANGDILWEITRKSSVLLFAWREIASADDLTASFVLRQGVKLTPSWTWSETPKIQVELPISYEQQSSLGATGFTSDIATLAQQSSLSIIRLNLNYTPTPNVEMTAFVLHENRHSNNPLHVYQDQSVGLNMKVSF